MTDGDSTHAARNIAAKIKRNTLPPRTLASVLGLIPCLQERRARLRSMRASPRYAVLSLPEIPPMNNREPIPPTTKTTDAKFVFAGFQNECFWADWGADPL